MTAAPCSRTWNWCARSSPPAAVRRGSTISSCCGDRRPRVTSGRNACGRRTTSSRGPGASPFSSPCCRRSRSSPRPAAGARSPQAPSRSWLAAEAGRTRHGGTRVFPVRASFFSLAWLAERAVCSWLAVGARVILGGVPYRGRILRHAATPMRVLRARHSARLWKPASPREQPDRHGPGHRSA